MGIGVKHKPEYNKKEQKMNKKTKILTVTALISAFLLAGVGGILIAKGKKGTGQNKPQVIEQTKPVETEKSISDMFDYYGKLSDVSGGSSTGEAGFSFNASQFTMKAEIANLPNPEGDSFYEGWIVNPETKDFISTGKLSLVDSTWINSFQSEKDYTSFSKYVLTLEPNDNDPAPAKHITEGVLSKKDSNPENTPSATKTEAKNGYVSLNEYQSNKSAYSGGKVVLFFNASWCPTCKVLNESLVKQTESFPKDLIVVNVDYDKETELKSKYGIKVQHTLVQIDSSGNQIAKWSGGGDLQSITDQLK